MPITDLFLAGTDEVETLVEYTIPKENILLAKNILDELKVAQLQIIVMSGDLIEIMRAYDPAFVISEEEGPWVYKWPDEFVSRLAQLNAEELKHAAHEWYQIEDIQLLPVLFDDETYIYELLQQIQQFAVRAVNLKKHLFVLCSI